MARHANYRGKLHWKKKKLLTILANRKQWEREIPTYSSPIELITEAGAFFLTETSGTSEPNLEYLATEQ